MNDEATYFEADGEDALTTDALEPGMALTQAQINALRALERTYVEGRGRYVQVELAEEVLHAFGCVAQGSCSCAVTRPV